MEKLNTLSLVYSSIFRLLKKMKHIFLEAQSLTGETFIKKPYNIYQGVNSIKVSIYIKEIHEIYYDEIEDVQDTILKSGDKEAIEIFLNYKEIIYKFKQNDSGSNVFEAKNFTCAYDMYDELFDLLDNKHQENILSLDLKGCKK